MRIWEVSAGRGRTLLGCLDVSWIPGRRMEKKFPFWYSAEEKQEVLSFLLVNRILGHGCPKKGLPARDGGAGPVRPASKRKCRKLRTSCFSESHRSQKKFPPQASGRPGGRKAGKPESQLVILPLLENASYKNEAPYCTQRQAQCPQPM